MTVLTQPARRLKRRRRVRAKVHGSAERPRISVFRSNRGVFAQLIDDDAGRTLVSASTRSKSLRGKVPKGGSVAAAKAIGEAIAELAREQKIESVVFDRSGFLYHGRIRAVADAARKAGLEF